jgi:hypothetical protein
MCFAHAWTLYRGFTDECADNNTAYCSISVYLVTSDKILEKEDILSENGLTKSNVNK